MPPRLPGRVRAGQQHLLFSSINYNEITLVLRKNNHRDHKGHRGEPGKYKKPCVSSFFSVFSVPSVVKILLFVFDEK
jgi:hypothetical protein